MNPRVASCSLLQGIFPTQGLNLGLLHGRRILYQLSHQGSLCPNLGLASRTNICGLSASSLWYSVREDWHQLEWVSPAWISLLISSSQGNTVIANSETAYCKDQPSCYCLIFLCILFAATYKVPIRYFPVTHCRYGYHIQTSEQS